MVPAVEKADQIFSFLMGQPEGSSLKEISSTLDIPKSTAHRLLVSLTALDYIEHDSHSGRFSLGPKLLSLSRAAERRLNLNRIAAPYLEELAEKSRETVKLSVIRHEKIYVISTVLSPRKMKITVESGTVFPPHIGAAGKTALRITFGRGDPPLPRPLSRSVHRELDNPKRCATEGNRPNPP